MDATNELRFGEMRDSAVLWGQRRELGGREFDALADDYYNPYAPTKFWVSKGNSLLLRAMREQESASYNFMVASEKSRVALLNMHR